MVDEPIALFRGGERPAPRNLEVGEAPHAARERGETVMFDRRELRSILDVYGRKVAEGEWRDYAIGMGRDRATFAVFRRSTEVPLYRIEKRPKLRQRQGLYSVIAATGYIMKRGPDLTQVLRVLEQRRPQLVE